MIRRRLGEILLRAGAIDAEQLARALAEQAQVDFAAPPFPTSDPDLLARFPLEKAEALLLLPLARDANGVVRVAAADPFDAHAQSAVSAALGAPVSIVISPADMLRDVIRMTYAAAEVATDTAGDNFPDDDDAEELELLDADEYEPEVDEEPEERIVEVPARSLSLGTLSPLSTVPPGLHTAPRSAGTPPPPVVHTVTDEDSEAAFAAEPLDLDDDTEEAALELDLLPDDEEELPVEITIDSPELDLVEELDEDDEEIIVQPTGPTPRLSLPELAPAARPPLTATPASPPPLPTPMSPPTLPPDRTEAVPSNAVIAAGPVVSDLEEDTQVTGRPSNPSAGPVDVPPSPTAPRQEPASLLITTEPLVLDEDMRPLGDSVQALRESDDSSAPFELLRALLAQGLERGSDALYLRDDEGRLRIDYRVEGVLQPAIQLPSWSRAPVRSALRAVFSAPADAPLEALVGLGLEARWKGRPVRCRVVVAKDAPRGEVLLRLRDSGAGLDLDALGFSAELHKRLKQWKAARQGLILVVGPRDSGRSTTLRAIARAERRRTCVVGQWDLFPSDGRETYRYGSGPGETDVRAALQTAIGRDPDVVIIDGVEGAIEEAILAAEEGRLVVAGMTANNAIEGLQLLLQSATAGRLGLHLLGILEQRAAHRLCAACRTTVPLDVALAERMGLRPETMPRMLPSRGPGCRSCRHLGVRGRQAVFSRVECSGNIPSGSHENPRRLRQYVRANRPLEPAEEGLGLVVQGRLSLGDLATSLGFAAAPTPQSPVVVKAQGWNPLIEETVVDERRVVEDEGGSGAFLAVDTGPEAPERLLLVVGGELDGALRSVLPGPYRVARVSDVAAARDFIQRRSPRAVVLPVGADPAGTIAQITMLRDDMAAAFLPLVTVGGEPASAAGFTRAGADATVPDGLTGEEIGRRILEAVEGAH